MLFLFNKDKIIAYVVTICTVIILFFTASVMEKREKSIQTSVKQETINKIENNEL